VLIKRKHMCAMAQGVRDTHSVMKVSVMHGVFQKDQNARAELLMRLTRT
jgi:GTP cyclohydrolase I